MKMKQLVFLVISLFIIIVFIGFNNIEKEDNTMVEDRTITVGGKAFPEQDVLVEIIAQLIEENTDIKVIRKIGIDDKDIHNALINKEIDLYPEYTSTIWVNILGQQPIGFADILYNEVKKMHLDRYNVKWLDRYGFNNSYGLAMKRQRAEELGINSISDLSFLGRDLVFGGEEDFFTREDTYKRLNKVYKFNFKDTKIVDLDKKYDSLDSGEVDVIDIFLTDAALEEYDLKILEDDLKYFPPYEAATIIRVDVLEKYPELEEILNKLGGQISEDEIRNMNKLVKEGMDPKEVARLFLKSKGLIS